MVRVGDVLNVDVRMELFDVPDDATTIDPSDYRQKYYVEYANWETKEFVSYDYEVEAGCTPSCGWDIIEFIKEDLPIAYKEITDYEIFDANDKVWDYMSAKIRVKAVKNIDN